MNNLPLDYSQFSTFSKQYNLKYINKNENQDSDSFSIFQPSKDKTNTQEDNNKSYTASDWE